MSSVTQWDRFSWVVANVDKSRFLAGFRYLYEAEEYADKMRKKTGETIVVIDFSRA